MPAAYRNCPFCSKNMRSDSLKHHLKGHLKAVQEKGVENWVKLPNCNVVVNVIKRPVTAEKDAHTIGVCLDCCRVIEKGGPMNSYTQVFVDHVCRAQGTHFPKRGQTTESGSVSTAKPDYESVWSSCRSRVMNMRMPKGVDATRWTTFKAKLSERFTKAESMAVDDDDENAVIDYAEALSDMMAGLAYDLWLAEGVPPAPAPAPAPAVTAPVSPVAAPPSPPPAPSVVKTAQPMPSSGAAPMNIHPSWPAGRTLW